MSTDVEKWIKRSNKKGARLVSYANGKYKIVYADKCKARIGTVYDGMRCRYGIRCHAAMPSTDELSLWQVPGECTRGDVKAMQDYLSGQSKFPEFDFATIKDLEW